ncbi:cupin domain-containing protein [bacterium]|nr:MAG: cupin domain-containing protein [bacterium]
MFYKRDETGYRGAMKGVSLKTLTYGEKTLLAEFLLTGGEILPAHAHPHEQIGYLVSGALLLDIGGETFEVNPGDSWCIPGNVEHGAKILKDSVAIEVFSPVREDFLPAGG